MLALALITLLFSSFPVNLRLSPPAAAALLLLFIFLLNRRRRRPVFLLNYSCYKPPPQRRCSFQAAESFLRRQSGFPPAAVEFMRGIYLKSGLGERTYAPPFIFEDGGTPTLKHASREAEEGISATVDGLLAKTRMDPLEIDAVVVACGSFSPSPSLSSLIVNRYNLRSDVKTYDLSGMGCSSGAIAVDTAARVVRGGRKARVALVVVTESITLNWYGGESRAMLVSNCIFRVGCAAAIVSSHGEHRAVAKMELVDSVRTHHGWDDSAYRAAYQEEDSEGRTGISLTKDLIRVAGVHLRQHIRVLAPRVLPLSVLAQYVYSKKGAGVGAVPDFSRAFEHMCIHTGGKAVIENVGRVLGLSDEVTEPARMSLNRFGNTSSSLVFYELAYFEAKKRAKKGDRMWMLAFGTGFKVGSLVWKWLTDSTLESDNPWMDCVDDYPLKAW
ncbi:Probable 3-ketoacyl-CoA synthase 2 [Striga hermonthica]|uniref:3-ketoacyl-CoA synthase n=1 Tax=Striga hermonthica TaxID=68872 RepID=A0A9N7RP45_STRHE|nr:Probable 3-ketoacyl-CoA synthase 2 [Striga hermonthica]